MTLRFEWDSAKAAANDRKHGVSFEEARTVVHCERAGGAVIRIISARKADRGERDDYASQRPE